MTPEGRSERRTAEKGIRLLGMPPEGASVGTLPSGRLIDWALAHQLSGRLMVAWSGALGDNDRDDSGFGRGDRRGLWEARKTVDARLLRQAITRYLAGLLIMGALLFIPAGTLDWWQAWLLLAILFAPMLVAGLVMMQRSPGLLRKRLNAKEEEGEQREVVALSALMFVAAFVVAGLTMRLGWPAFPAWVSWLGAVVFLASYALYAEVMRENAYLSRTIEVQEDQQVVDTGLYGVVRHPMYAVTLFLFLSMPLVLGSPLSCVIMLAYLPIITKRIRNEEEVLAKGLPGYAEYMTRVRWRLVPHVW